MVPGASAVRVLSLFTHFDPDVLRVYFKNTARGCTCDRQRSWHTEDARLLLDHRRGGGERPGSARRSWCAALAAALPVLSAAREWRLTSRLFSRQLCVQLRVARRLVSECASSWALRSFVVTCPFSGSCYRATFGCAKRLRHAPDSRGASSAGTGCAKVARETRAVRLRCDPTLVSYAPVPSAPPDGELK